MQIPDDVLYALLGALVPLAAWARKNLQQRGDMAIEDKRLTLADRQQDIEREKLINELVPNLIARIDGLEKQLRDTSDTYERKIANMQAEIDKLRERIDYYKEVETERNKLRSDIAELRSENQALTQRLIDCEQTVSELKE